MPTLITDPDLLAQLNAPDRAPVASSKRVWGDKEAEAAGIYETPQRSPGPRPVTDPALLSQLNGDVTVSSDGRPRITIRPSQAVAQRFDEPAQQTDMQPAMARRVLEMTQGDQVSPVQQLTGQFLNVLSGAQQGTDPNIDRYGGRMVSDQVFQNDAGEVVFRDPATGNFQTADQSKYVALRDPVDNRIKIFDRSESTNESPVVGASRVLSQGMVSGAPTARPGIPYLIPRASDIMATAKPYYRAFEAAAAAAPAVNANDAKVIVDRLQHALDTAHLPMEVAKQVHDTVALVGKRGGDTTPQTLQYVKRAIGNLFKSPDPNVRAGAGVASKEIMRIITEISPQAGQSLKTADQIHSAAKGVQQLQRLEGVAGLRTGRAGYGGNAVNSMRQVLSPIVEAAIKGRTTGFRPDEIAAMREIVHGTTGTNIARGIGQLSPTKGVIQTGVGIATLGVTPIIGAVANKIATVMTAKQIQRLN